MNRMLLVVDPQVDFITGSLPVPEAEKAMDGLARYIAANNGKYAVKIVTADRHPYDHSSFKDFGGIWPSHCVHDTTGAAVWQPLFKPLYTTEGAVYFFYKGENPEVEEYSIFKNIEASASIERIVRQQDIDKIDICGLAGDVCVLNTLKEAVALFGKERVEALTEFSPSLDGGDSLNEFVHTYLQ